MIRYIRFNAMDGVLPYSQCGSTEFAVYLTMLCTSRGHVILNVLPQESEDYDILIL